MENSFANRNVRYKMKRDLSNFSIATEKSFTNITVPNQLVSVKPKSSRVLSKLVIAFIVFGIVIVIGIVTTAVLVTSKDEDGDKQSDKPSGENTSGMSTTTRTTMTMTSTTTSTTTANTTTESGGNWGLWGEWTTCTSTCDSGIHKRYRSCNGQDSTQCAGDFIETEVCVEAVCPVYGKWTTWESWGSCSLTCDRGIQSRTRICTKAESSDIDCVGTNSQNKTCSEWECPDCSKTCSIGTLNADCDSCVCDGVIVSGRVLSVDNGNPISNAAFYATTAPTKLLGQSNSTGFFSLADLCVDTTLLVTRSGFVDETISIKSDYLLISITRQVSPYLTEVPQTKYRLTGENVTFCCKAVANPPIEYFEWFKDGQIMNENLYQEGSSVSLINLTGSDSGRYQCRANSPTGAIMSPIATLIVKDDFREFCSDSLQQKTLALPDDCVQTKTNTTTYEVGECIPKSCRGNITTEADACHENIVSCCTIGDANLEKVQCSGYELEVVVVRSCSCGTCTSGSLKISGTASGSEDGSPLKFGEVWMNGVFQTYTSISGTFNVDISKNVFRVTINLKDVYFRQFLPTVKVIEINDQMTGVLRVAFPMIKAAEPVSIDSSIENTLVAGSSVNNESSSVIQISIPANAFYYSNGTQYIGTVDASLTFLDPTNSSVLNNIPGSFEIVDEEGQSADLDSLGVFSLYFEDTFGQPLVLDEVIDFYIPLDVVQNEEMLDEIKLWIINSETGLWEYVTQSTGTRRRKKRTNTAHWIGELDMSSLSQSWFNYDMIRKRSFACFFKIRLFKGTGATETVSYARKTINVQSHILKGNILTTIKHYLYSPEDQCMTGLCEGMHAYLSLFYYGRDGIENLFALAPKLDEDSHFYQVTDEDKVLKIEMSTSENGPFYKNEKQCKASPSTENHLQFHYGKSTEIFTFMKVFYLPGPGSDIVLQIHNSQRTWYPDRSPEGYRVCFMKVRINLQFEDLWLLNDDIKIKATSKGGIFEDTRNFIFGIRQYELSAYENTTFCIEYKCSGIIDPIFTGEIDNTRVVLELVYPTNTMTSEITTEADFVSDFPSLSNNAQLGLRDGLYAFNVPAVYAPEYGLYSATSDLKDIESATNTAERECRSGNPQKPDEENPERGVAVTFTLTMENPCSVWWWYRLFYDC